MRYCDCPLTITKSNIVLFTRIKVDFLSDEYDPDAEDSSSVPVYVKEEILLGMKPSQKSRSRSHIPLPEECYYSQAIKDQGSDGEEEYQVYQEEDGLHIQTASEPSSKDVQESEVEFRTIYAAKRQPPSKGRRNPDRDAKDVRF